MIASRSPTGRALRAAVLAALPVLLTAAAPAAAQEPPAEPSAEVAAPQPASEPTQGSATAAEPSVNPAELVARPLRGAPTAMAALLVGGGPAGSIALAPFAAPLPPASPDAAAAPVLLAVEIDGAGLLGAAPAERLEPAVYAYALADGAVRGFFARAVELDLEAVGERLAAGGLRLLGILELPPGSYELRVLVHEPASGRHGLRSTRVEIPAAASPPFFAGGGAEGGGGAWLLAVDSGGGVFELLQGAGLAPPAALPVLTGDTAVLDLLVATPAAAAGKPAERFEARFADAEGRPLARAVAVVAGRQAAGASGTERLRLALPLAGVEPGSYFLTLAAPGLAAAPPVPVIVPGIDAEGLEWPDVLHQRVPGSAASGNALQRPAAPRAELELAPGRRRAGDEALQRATAAAYRAVLARLAVGEREEAVDDLVRIERQAAGTATADDAFAALAAAEAEVLAALAAADRAAALPLVPLHLAAYQRHRADGAYALTTHSRNQAVAAAEAFAAGGGEDAARLAAAALTVLGAELQEGQVRLAAQRLLERAVELDPASRPALLRLAAGHEKAADPAAAAAALRRLLAVDTKTPEGRARLAVNLLRLGDREGEVLLRRLIAEDNPEWVLSLAYQELGRVLLEAGRDEEAWTLLEQGAARLPADLGLAAARAYAAERSGRPTRAREVVAALAPRPEAASPRHLYARWPREGLAEAAELVERAAMLRLPALAAALAASERPAGRRRR